MYLLSTMFRESAIFAVALVLIQVVAAAATEEEPEHQHFVFSLNDAVPESKLTGIADERDYGFIGDLVIGRRRPNAENVFTRLLEINNPTNDVISNWFTLNVENGGTIHFLSVINIPDSYGVVCDDPYSLGGSKAGFRVRTPPNSKVVLTITLGVHYA